MTQKMVEILIKLLVHRKIWQINFTIIMGNRREEPPIITDQEVNLIKSVVKGIIRKILGISDIISVQIFPKIGIFIPMKDRTTQ